jgi:hypothetical protein
MLNYPLKLEDGQIYLSMKEYVVISYWTRGLFFEKNADKIGLKKSKLLSFIP